MEKIHTHYDNLKITRNAPLEVIKAAYKAMAQKYHPDRNPSKDAERVMKLVNEAWDVLSDVNRRAAHDRWIAEQEAQQAASVEANRRTQYDAPRPRSATSSFNHSESVNSRRQHYNSEAVKPPKSTATTGERASKPISNVGIFFVVGIALVMLYLVNDASKLAASNPPQPLPVPRVQPVKVEPARAPPVAANSGSGGYRQEKPGGDAYRDAREHRALLEYGQSLPTSSGPILGAMQSSSVGLSTVTIDNSQSGSDVVLKLCDGGWAHCLPVRHVYVARGARFTMRGIAPGDYDIRYVSLESGAINKSPKFELLEIETSQGTQFSNVTMTLYTVSGGNTRMTKIGADQF